VSLQLINVHLMDGSRLVARVTMPEIPRPGDYIYLSKDNDNDDSQRNLWTEHGRKDCTCYRVGEQKMRHMLRMSTVIDRDYIHSFVALQILEVPT